MEKSDLRRSHDDLRAALRMAGKEIGKLNFGRSDTPVPEAAAPRAERGTASGAAIHGGKGLNIGLLLVSSDGRLTRQFPA